MPTGGRGPFWTRRSRSREQRKRPFWSVQDPPRRGGPWWLRPGPAGQDTPGGAGSAGAGQAGPGTPRGSRPSFGGGLGPAGGVPGASGTSGPSGPAHRPAGGLVWIGVRLTALLAVVVVLAATAGFLLERADGGPVAAQARSTGHDALWMDHAWLDGRRGPADLRLLAARIRGSGISDVYVFAGGLDHAGRLAAAGYAGATAFLASFRAACPGVRVSAWLGGVIGADHIDLSDRATRGRIVAATATVLHAGFTGVHYDLEPVTSGDPGLLALLSASRALHPDPLSVAVPKLEPLPGMRLPAQLGTGRPVFWTPAYLTQVASRADQVAVMSYDTGMPFQSWYGGYVERETALALRAVSRQTALLMGVPAFHNGDLGHHPGAETVAAAIHGIRVALTAAGSSADHFGVALFADFSATSQDWTSYLRDWVKPG
jgi:hypothetical protein